MKDGGDREVMLAERVWCEERHVYVWRGLAKHEKMTTVC